MPLRVQGHTAPTFHAWSCFDSACTISNSEPAYGRCRQAAVAPGQWAAARRAVMPSSGCLTEAHSTSTSATQETSSDRWAAATVLRWCAFYRLTGPHVLKHECGAGTQRWQVGNGGGGGDGAADASQREALRLEVARLRNATSHLERSNDELKAALAADPSDQDFKDALGVGLLVPHGRTMSEWSGGWKSMPSIVKL